MFWRRVVGGGSVELPSILSASPRRVNCPTLDSIQGQQDPQTDCCRRQTVFSRHPILRRYGTVIGSGVQAAPRVCSSLTLLTDQTWRRPAISTEVPRQDANSRNASVHNCVFFFFFFWLVFWLTEQTCNVTTQTCCCVELTNQWRNREFCSGGFNKFSWGQGTERKGIWGR